MHALAHIIPTTLYTLTLPTLSSHIPSPTPLKLSLLLLLHHLPHPYFVYHALSSPTYLTLAAFPLTILLLLLAHALPSALPLLAALPLLSYARAAACAAVAQLPPGHLARVDAVATVVAGLAPLAWYLPGGVLAGYVLLLVASFVVWYNGSNGVEHVEHVELLEGRVHEETPLLKPGLSPKPLTRLPLPLALTAFSTGTVHLVYPLLCTPPRPLLVTLLYLTSLTEPFFRNLPLPSAQLLGVSLALCGSLLLTQAFLPAGVMLLGCGGACVAVCAVRDSTRDSEDGEESRWESVVVMAGVVFAAGEAVGVLVGGFSPCGGAWAVVSCAMLVGVVGRMAWASYA